jgi:Kef-type K+ transport system membrane component KefB
LAVAALAISLVLAFAVTVPLSAAAVISDPTLGAFLIASTSIGVQLAVLGEKGVLRKPYGQRLLLMAVVADIITVLLLTIFFSTDESSTLEAPIALITALVMLGVALFWVLTAVTRRPALPPLVRRLSGATSRVPIRGSFALLLAFVALASEFGLEIILGTFMAGAIISTIGVPRGNPEYQLKMDAIGHGFFVPVFFVLAGHESTFRHCSMPPIACC